MSTIVQVWRRALVPCALAAVLLGPILGQAEAADALADSLAELLQPNVLEPSGDGGPSLESRAEAPREIGTWSCEASLALSPAFPNRPARVGAFPARRQHPPGPIPLARRLALFPSLLL